VDVNSLSYFGRSPLFEPSRYGSEWVVTPLLEAGANPDLVDEGGDSALTMARMHGHEKVAKVLEGWKRIGEFEFHAS
jgi:ankyrin repeat protein